MRLTLVALCFSHLPTRSLLSRYLSSSSGCACTSHYSRLYHCSAPLQHKQRTKPRSSSPYLTPHSSYVDTDTETSRLGGNAAPQTAFQEKAQALFEQGKRLAKVYLGNTPVDYDARDKSDKEAGVVRLTDENWDREMAAWDGDWAIVMYVEVSYPPTTRRIGVQN